MPSQGNPTPRASWTHNGHALDSQRVNVRTGDQDSILFIRSAQRSDSGCYELTVQLEGLEAKAAIDILVIGMEPRETGRTCGNPEAPPALDLMADGVRPRESDGSQILGGGIFQQAHFSPSPRPPTLCSYRETRIPQQHQATGRLGLQCCP